MEETRKKKKSGLQLRILRLSIGIVVVAILLFAVVGIYETRTVRNMINSNQEAQSGNIKAFSEDLMTYLLEDWIEFTVYQAAKNSDGEFWSMKHDYTVLAAQVKDIFMNPDNYAEVEISPPRKENGGKYALQLMFADWADKNDEKNLRMARKLANLAPEMKAIIIDNDQYSIDCIIAMPCGISIVMDDMSDRKFVEGDKLMDYDCTKRIWYKGALEKKGVYFSPAMDSYFYDYNEVSFGVPIYVDDELVAVLQGSTRLDTLQKFVSELNYGKTGFSILLSGEGQLVYSPKTTGELAMKDNISHDIRQTASPELKALIEEALKADKGVSKISIDGENYDVAYATLGTLGWTQMMFVEDDELYDPVTQLLDNISKADSETYALYEPKFKYIIRVILVVMVMLLIGAIFAAVVISRKIVTPLKVMTKKVEDMNGEHMTFDLEPVYETGDEIEVLAGSFNKLTYKLKDYIAENMRITAEKEKIDAEMATANKIQSSMLKRKFPAFPDKTEFDLYADMVPAKEVGGDLYDFYFIDEDNLALVIGDVSGKGVTAALFMVMTKHVLESQIKIHKGDVVKAMEEANAILMEENAAKMFVTVWLGVINVKTGHVVYVNAGHEYPIIYRKGGQFECFKDKHGAMLACSRKILFFLNEMDLQSGDILYLYTDGVTEATAADMSMFGRDRLLEVLNENVDKDIADIDKAVRSFIQEFVGGAQQFDDITSLCFKYFGG